MTTEPKRSIRIIFDEADDYDRDVGLFAAFGAHLVDRAGLRPGDRVLDMCCGRGASLVPAAHVTGPSGRVVGIDLSPQMVRRSREALAVAGLADRADVIVEDMEHLPFDDGSFDTVLCGFGVFFAEDVDAMLHGVRRVLRVDGRFVFSLFAGPPLWPWLFEIIVRHAGGGTGGEHPMWTAEGAVEQLERAGFADPVLHGVTETFVIPSLDVVWTQLWSLGTRPLLERMDETTQRIVKQEIGDRLEEHRVANGFESASAASIVTAFCRD